MLERQRILLELVRATGKTPSRTHIMKWLFLLKQECAIDQQLAYYDFLPYRFGPFSFVVSRELADLATHGLLAPDQLRIPALALPAAEDEVAKLGHSVISMIREIMRKYGNLSRRELIQAVYKLYPWFASRSELSKIRVFNRAELAVYTIGYEGRSIDSLLNTLLFNGIRKLIDVRKNSFSRKYGYSGKTLDKLCKKVEIEYVQYPELGIPSGMRTNIDSVEQRERLFDYYESSILSREGKAIEQAAIHCTEVPSALMCFENTPQLCHRGRLATSVSILSQLPVQHL